jgi:Fic family protein
LHPYVWQRKGWPEWRWQDTRLIGPLARARLYQGRLLGKIAGLGFELGLEVRAEVLAEETVKTAAIEGESLSRESVRSSVARRLGLPTAGLPPVERHVDGLVEMLIDATGRMSEPLTAERLKGWQAALFPTGYSGLHRLRVGKWRTGRRPMQVVSGPLGREKIHYEAPPASRVEAEITRLLDWWEASPGALDGILRAAVAHVWFVTIHPFEDGNGRIARAIADMALAQDERTSARFYSMSAQISADRDAYYAVLQRAQRGDGELTDWLLWFLECLERSVTSSETRLEHVFLRARFWQRHARTQLSERQRKAVARLLNAGRGGFEGWLTTRKYVGMTRASRATAQREISDLVEKGVLRKTSAGGRSTSYEVVWEDER